MSYWDSDPDDSFGGLFGDGDDDDLESLDDVFAFEYITGEAGRDLFDDDDDDNDYDDDYDHDYRDDDESDLDDWE